MEAFDLARRCGRALANGQGLWLFLDYDGTLADFAPTPDTLLPDPALIALLGRLAALTGRLKVIVLSGRRLSHILTLLPLPGILAAGTYGIEYRTWQGETVERLAQAELRAILDPLKAQWAALIAGHKGFYLEDKGYSLALHARDAQPALAEQVQAQAEQAARRLIDDSQVRLVGGERFLEAAPLLADKGRSVIALLALYGWQGEPLVYIGDDDKDEAAFAVVRQRGGSAVQVGRAGSGVADYHLSDPQSVRRWLETLLAEAGAAGD